MTNLHIYGRYSDRPAESMADMKSQIDRCDRYVEMRSLEHQYQHVYKDPAISGGTLLRSRHGGSKLISRTRKGDHIVAANLSRLFRDASDAIVTAKLWMKKGVTLHLADQGGTSIDASTPMGFRMFCFLAGDAEAYRMEVSKYTSDGMLKRQANGESMGGQPPFGKQRVHDPITDKYLLVDDPAEVKAIRIILDLAKGDHSVRAIARILTDLGHYSRTGGDFRHQTVQMVINEKKADEPS